MEESKETKTSILCPFCGAPYRNIVPSDVAQIKCEYCSATFSVASYFRNFAPRCPNHPDIFGTGLCNDCGRHFCTRCLQVYDLRTDNVNTRLYLCPECVCSRKLGRANASVFMGILFVVGFGLIWLMFSHIEPPVGNLAIMIVLCGVLVIVYGIWKRGSILREAEEKMKKEIDEEELTKETESAESTHNVDTDVLYGKMLSKYMMKCSLINAKELLDNEIRAYVRTGLSYEEAVYKVAEAKELIKAETKRTK